MDGGEGWREGRGVAEPREIGGRSIDVMSAPQVPSPTVDSARSATAHQPVLLGIAVVVMVRLC